MKNWDEIFNEALKHFRAILAMDTSNPPGNEILVARYLSKVLEDNGIKTTVLESAPGRGNIVARYSTGGTSGPLLLSSHVDVVHAEREKWTHPPFGGDVADGYIWGRGAVDMKNMTIYCLMAMLLLKRQGLKLKRDVIFCAVADEEAGSEMGMTWVVKNHPDLIRAEYALNEIGGFTTHISGRRFYTIQIAEKGFLWARIRTRGEPGHGSMPHDKNAVINMAKAVERLSSHQFPMTATGPMKQFITGLTENLPFPLSILLKGLLKKGLSPLLLKIFPDKEQARVFRASLHHTICPTCLEAGRKVNVIPSEALALLDCRILPGTSPEAFLEEVKKIAGPEIEVEVIKSGRPTTMSADTPLFRAIANAVEKNDPGSKAVPHMVTGFTDAKPLSELGIITYGFTPIKLEAGLKFTNLFHGHNERIPVEGFRWGLKVFCELVEEFCSQ